MNIQNNNRSTSFLFGSATNWNSNRRNQVNETSNKNSTKNSDNNKNGKSILATELNMNQQDSVTTKKIKAQKEAMKTIIGQFTNDHKIDDNLKSRREHMSALNNEILESQNEVSKIEDLKHQVKDASGVTDDSEEQLNLELLEKQRESLKKGSFVKLTDVEKQKLKTMGPETEYQSAILAYDSMQDEWKDKIKAANKETQAEIGMIKGIKKELLKTHPMVDAKVEAKDILDAANKEVTGLLINEAKDHIDEEQDKAEEKAKKEAEKKAQEDALKEKAVENNVTLNSNNEAASNSGSSNSDKTNESSKSNKTNESSNSKSIDNMSQIQKAESEQQKLQVEFKNLVDSQKLTIDDTKGIIVDKQL